MVMFSKISTPWPVIGSQILYEYVIVFSAIQIVWRPTTNLPTENGDHHKLAYVSLGLEIKRKPTSYGSQTQTS